MTVYMMDEKSQKSMRIFLCGAHSTGKTTLLEDLTSRISMHAEREVARSVMASQGMGKDFVDWKHHPDKFEILQRAILQRQNEIEDLNENRDYIMDRGIDPVVYARMFLGPDAEKRLIETESTQRCIKRYRDKRTLIFVITPHEECIHDDGVRMVPKMSELLQFTDHMFDVMKSLDIPFHVISMLDREERVNFILQKMKC